MADDKGWKGFMTVTDQEALEFHSREWPGKLEIIPTKPMAFSRPVARLLPASPSVMRIAEIESGI